MYQLCFNAFMKTLHYLQFWLMFIKLNIVLLILTLALIHFHQSYKHGFSQPYSILLSSSLTLIKDFIFSLHNIALCQSLHGIFT